MKEVTLLTAELAYLFTLIDAKTALGVDTARLFPTDAAQQKAVYEAGYEALKRHEWITTNKKSGKDDLNLDLMVFVDAVANPKYVIVTDIRLTPSAPPRRLIHQRQPLRRPIRMKSDPILHKNHVLSAAHEPFSPNSCAARSRRAGF